MWILRRKGYTSAKKLGEILNCKTSATKLPRQPDFIVNYGLDYKQANLNANVIFDKLEAHRILESKGILVPQILKREVGIEKFPILARKRFHSQGKDIIYIENKEQLDSLDPSSYNFLVQYIKKNSEYRVHILGDHSEFVSVKVNHNEDANQIVRSHDNGWVHVEYDGEFRNELVRVARAAIKALGYDFGAVDIIRTKYNKFYVLEINSNCGLEDRKIELYADYFKSEEKKWIENNSHIHRSLFFQKKLRCRCCGRRLKFRRRYRVIYDGKVQCRKCNTIQLV